jgi:plastocyanin
VKKEYLIIPVVLFLAGISVFFLRANDRNGRSIQEAPQEVPQETPIVDIEEGGAVEENTIVYTDSGFRPDNLTVKQGVTVVFINDSNKPMWVASDPHPAHTDYPSLDQLGNGNEYSFTFTEVGSYPYHNHSLPNDTGIVIVE